MKNLPFTQKKVSENPFFRMKETLNLYNALLKKNVSQLNNLLNLSWKECKDDLEKRKLFFSILFTAFDIENRDHNIFKIMGIKAENGGSSVRDSFITISNWMLSNCPQQFYYFLPLFGEYYNKGGIFLYSNKTDRFKGNLISTNKVNIDIDKIIPFIADCLKNHSDNEMVLWARWLPKIPNSSKRKREYTITAKNINTFKKNGHKDINIGDVVVEKKNKQRFTLDKDSHIIEFIQKLSKAMDWKIVEKQYTDFVGYRKFRSKYLINTEAHLFSSKKILEKDKIWIINWLDTLPSSARFRVQKRVLNKSSNGKLVPKEECEWKNKQGEHIGSIFLEWMSLKEKAQKELSSLSKEEKEKIPTKDLKKMEKAAKVNVGATSLVDEVFEVISNKNSEEITNLKAFSILEKIQLDITPLLIVDTSGSMTNNAYKNDLGYFSAIKIASFLATLFLLKNPDEDMNKLLIRFNNTSDVLCAGQEVSIKKNSFSTITQAIKIDKLVDKQESFIKNFTNISNLLACSGATNIESLSRMFKIWVDSVPEYKSSRIEQINNYPVFLFLSDGAFNSSETPTQSLTNFQQDMLNWFGWNGVCVLWDISQDINATGGINKFSSCLNTVYLGGMNAGILNQVFTKLSDLDVIDPFVPLKTFYETNRYSPVRNLVV